ncbi:MAG: hypothetical protein O2782_00460 [bacterium]|nr:hypothetical protein [bacterium]
MELFPEPATHAVLPDAVHQQLWERIHTRLQRGDTLITTKDYVTAVTSEYEAITGEALTSSLRELFQDAIDNYNRDYPERYVAIGVRNSVVRAFQSGCFKLNWDVLQIESAGARSIARFKSRDWVRGFLKEVHVAPSAIRPGDCVQSAKDVISGRSQRLVQHDPAEPVIPARKPAQAVEPLSADTVEALGDGTISQGEVESRQKEQDRSQARIEAQEMSRAGERAESYVRQGYLTMDEGEAVRQLSDVDARLARGEIDAAEASHLRNSLLTKEQRYALERKVKGAVDHAVRFLQTFESMQRISTELDEGLEFLIYHKNILDADKGPVERGRAAQALLEDRDMLHKIIDIMDRKDQEIRMISVGLPPYSYVVKRNERIGNLIIEEQFIADLRRLSVEDMSDRLHSEDPLTRVRPAADVRCLIAIISHLIKPTAWRKDVRMLRVQDTIEQFYHETEDIGEARKQAESFLARRLRRMFKDLNSDEKEEMEQKGAHMIDAIEQKIVTVRQAAAAAEGAGQTDVSTADEDSAHDDDALTEEEMKKGATIARVEMRVAGQMRRVPRKIMLNPDDADEFVLAQRNRDTGELEPVLRRGSPRVIERGTDGYWTVTSN